MVEIHVLMQLDKTSVMFLELNVDVFYIYSDAFFTNNLFYELQIEIVW